MEPTGPGTGHGGDHPALGLAGTLRRQQGQIGAEIVGKPGLDLMLEPDGRLLGANVQNRQLPAHGQESRSSSHLDGIGVGVQLHLAGEETELKAWPVMVTEPKHTAREQAATAREEINHEVEWAGVFQGVQAFPQRSG